MLVWVLYFFGFVRVSVGCGGVGCVCVCVCGGVGVGYGGVWCVVWYGVWGEVCDVRGGGTSDGGCVSGFIAESRGEYVGQQGGGDRHLDGKEGSDN